MHKEEHYVSKPGSSEEDRLKCEQELLKTKVFLETVVNGIQDQIMVIGKDGRIIDVNEAVVKAVGLPKNEIVGKFCSGVSQCTSEPCIDLPCSMEYVFESRRPSQVCYTRYDEGGKPRCSEITMYPVKDEKGHTTQVIEISRDVTKRMFLEQEIRESEAKFRGIVETATDAIITIDRNHKIILFNRAAEDIFGYGWDEVMGKDLNILIPPRYGDHSLYVKRYIKTRTPHVIGKVVEATALRKGGEEFPVRIARSVAEVKGQLIFTAIIRDQTQSKQLEGRLIQFERLAAVGEVVAHVSHEIKNPLTVIGGFSNQLIHSPSRGEKDRQKLQIIVNEVKRLEQFLAGIGDFTKPIEPIRQVANLNEIVEDTYALMEGKVREKGVQFEKVLYPDIPLSMLDPNQIRQVLVNLVKNALEATDQGGKISISTEMDSDFIKIHVSDTGKGIPTDLLDGIFSPFFTTKERGTGLGLSVCYKIIKNHEGKIRVQSKLTKGSLFTIALPIKKR